MAKKRKRQRFSQTDLLKRLADTRPVCKICGKSARQVQLDTHRRDGDVSNIDWKNIVIYCRACYGGKHGSAPKRRRT